MPDYWGRPTFNDGLAIAQTVNYFQRENERQQDKATEQDAYKVADALSKKQDVSGYSPEARYKGAKLYWDDSFNKIRNETQQLQLSNEQMNQKVNKLKLNLAEAGERLRQYKAARAAGDDTAAKQIAIQLNNENMYNGRYVEPTPGERGGYDVTNWDGSRQKIKDLPMEQIDMFLGAYFDKPADEIMQWQISAEQLRAQKNADILSQAEPYINEKTGQIIYRVPAGVWGPDGKPRGAFFIDSPTAQSEVPKDKTKGFVKFGVAAGKAGLEATRADTAKKKQPSIINPTDVVTQGGKGGLIVQTPGGQPEFKPVQGGIDTSSLPAGKGAMNASQQYNLAVKRLETELMPFVEKGTTAIDPETLELTNNGRNALNSALKLVQKYQRDPNSLNEQESAILNNAVQALQMYQELSKSNRAAFGLQGNPQAPRSNVPQPPPGFVMDK